MSNETPRRLAKVVDNAAAAAPERLPRPEADVGQIWIAAPDEGPGVLVPITHVSDDHVHVLVLLCSSEGDVATETDAELAPRLTGCPRLKQLRTVKARASELGLKISTLSAPRDRGPGFPTPGPAVNR
jgi:hypothetical protein